MYDLHNHLLPGVDDGSPDLQTSLEMAKMAFNDGITHMICTPHIHRNVYNNNLETINNALAQFRLALEANNIKLNVSAAAEIRINAEIPQMIQNNSLPFLGYWQSTHVLLVEFPANAVPAGSDKLITWLLNNQVTPMIAHPERNSVFQSAPERLKWFMQQGCLTQITGGALLGNFGQKIKTISENLVMNDMATIVASDAHNIQYRPPLLKNVFEIVKNITDIENANKLFIQTPKTISRHKFEELQNVYKDI